LLGAGQTGLAATTSLQSVQARQCRGIDSSHPVVLQLTSPADGLLRVEVEEHGISTVSILNDVTATAAASPIARLGTVVLAAEVRGGERTKVDVHVDDSPDVGGEVCIAAELIAAANSTRAQAEVDFAAGGRATQATDWTTAFGRYQDAARRFDYLGLRRSAAKARHAMAEITYWRLDRKRDTYALASEAFADYGESANPALHGELAALEAQALIDMPDEDIVVMAPQVRLWLSVARRYLENIPFGARELPRLDILSGFLGFLLNDRMEALRFWA
jgi:hypothetical protein